MMEYYLWGEGGSVGTELRRFFYANLFRSGERKGGNRTIRSESGVLERDRDKTDIERDETDRDTQRQRQKIARREVEKKLKPS
jgi:hypothetical protein